MSLLRHNPQRDKAEPAVVEALERCGFVVERISQKGVPDLLVSRRGGWFVVEVKSHAEIGKRGKPLAKGKLREEQQAFRDRHRAPVVVLRSGLEAVEWSRNVP